MDPQTNPWLTLDVARRFADDFIIVEEHKVRDPAGKRCVYGVVRYRHRGLIILPVDADGSVTLIGQWRFAAGAYSWELPAGSMEPGEDPAAAARRELREEAGMTAENWLHLLSLSASPATTDERVVCFVAWNLQPCETDPDPQEVLQIRRVPFAEALRLALSGEIAAAPAVAAILALHARASRGDLPADLAQRLR